MADWPGVEGGQRLDEAPDLDAGRHGRVVLNHAGERLDAAGAVDRRLHSLGVEELAALDPRPLLVEVLQEAARTHEGGTVHVRRLGIGDRLADLVELVPRGRHRKAHLLEDILAVIEDEHVAIIREAVDGVADPHLVLAVDVADIVELRPIAVLVDVLVERLDRAGTHHVTHPGGHHVQDVIGAGAAPDAPASSWGTSRHAGLR